VSELAIQKFLRAGWGTKENRGDASGDSRFERLMELYQIKARRHRQHPNLVSFKYYQLSNFSEQIVRECRGIVLDEDDDWRVVSRAFDKFFNHGEGHAAPIDWSTAEVQAKVDGSLCTLYFYKDEWHVATTGTPDGAGPVDGSGDTFADYFWRTFRNMGGRVTHDDGYYAEPYRTNRCYYFELTGPANRIVVVHDTASLTLLGARDLETQEEITAATASLDFSRWVCTAPRFPLQSFDDIAASFECLSPLRNEGYVVVDGNFNRVKVKHPGYVALHHAKDGMTAKAFVEIARSGEVSEVLTAFPEFKPLLDEAKLKVELLANKLEAAYEDISGIAEQKAFALEAVKTRCPAALFAVRSQRAPSVRAFLAKMRIETLIELLEAS
jgi:hypothetical protein